MHLRQILGCLVGLGYYEVDHLLIAGTWKLLFLNERVVGMVYDHHATVHSPQHIIVVSTHEVCLAYDTVLLFAVAHLAQILKQGVDRLYLCEVLAPLSGSPVGYLCFVALQNVAISSVEVGALAHSDLVAKPRHEISRTALGKRYARHVYVESVAHVAIP